MKVAAPAESVWWFVGEKYGDIGAWAPGLESSFLEGELDLGAVRVCRTRASWPFVAGTVRERLITFDRGTMTLAYRAFEGLPGFMEHRYSRWTITALSPERCQVEVSGEIDVRGPWRLLAPLFRWQLGRMARRALERLATHVTRARLGRVRADAA
jgi:hypothetical protein